MVEESVSRIKRFGTAKSECQLEERLGVKNGKGRTSSKFRFVALERSDEMPLDVLGQLLDS